MILPNNAEQIINQITESLPETYRASFKVANMELGLTPDNIKKLKDATGKDADDIYGLNLSWSETKALCSVQKLLDRTDYQGHVKTRKIPTILGEFCVPIIYCDIPTYLTAYGLKKNTKARFNRRQRDEAIKALESLTKLKKICFERRYFEPSKKGRKKGQWMSDFLVTEARLIRLYKLYSYPSSNEEAQKLRLLQDSTRRARYLEISCSPLFVDQIDRQYLEKPENLFDEIEKAVGNKNRKSPKPIYNLILLLLQSDLQEYKIKKENLAYKLELQYLVLTRQQSRLESDIQEVIAIASQLGYLLGSRYDDQKQIYHLYPNPEKCSRLKRKTEARKFDNPPLSIYELIELDTLLDLVEPFML